MKNCFFVGLITCALVFGCIPGIEPVAIGEENTNLDDIIAKTGETMDIGQVLGLVAKVIVGIASPVATIFIVAFLVMFFNNTVKRFIGRAAFKRHGLSVKDRIREGTATGSIVLCIHRTAFDGFYGTIIGGGDEAYDEEKFIPWIGFESREVVLIRNYDPKSDGTDREDAASDAAVAAEQSD